LPASSATRAAGSTRIEPVLLVDRLAQHEAPAPGAPLDEVEEASGADDVARHAVDVAALRDRHLGLRDRALADEIDRAAAKKVQDADAAREALAA